MLVTHRTNSSTTVGLHRSVVWCAVVSVVFSLCCMADGGRHSSSPLSVELSATTASSPGPDSKFHVDIKHAFDSEKQMIAALELRNVETNEEYWAPFDAAGKPLPINGRAILTARPMRITIRPSDLHWAPSKSAVWPQTTLRQTVQAGTYEALITITVVAGDGSAESNRVRMTIGDRSK